MFTLEPLAIACSARPEPNPHPYETSTGLFTHSNEPAAPTSRSCLRGARWGALAAVLGVVGGS